MSMNLGQVNRNEEGIEAYASSGAAKKSTRREQSNSRDLRASMRMPNAAKQRELALVRSNSRMSLNMSRDNGALQSSRSKLGSSAFAPANANAQFFKKREMITLIRLLQNDDIFTKKKECRQLSDMESMIANLADKDPYMLILRGKVYKTNISVTKNQDIWFRFIGMAYNNSHISKVEQKGKQG